MSEFDELMVEADDVIWDVFGTVCQLIRQPGAAPESISVDLQRNLTPQQLGEKGRGGSGHRLNTLMIGAIPERLVPANLNQARLVVDGVRYTLTEPVPESGDVEFLLVPEVEAGTGGDRATQFLR